MAAPFLGALSASVATVAFFTLCVRERRPPTIVFLLELVGRWLHIRSERRDRWVSTAVIGYAIALSSVILSAALGGG